MGRYPGLSSAALAGLLDGVPESLLGGGGAGEFFLAGDEEWLVEGNCMASTAGESCSSYE